jgi:endonuclease-3
MASRKEIVEVLDQLSKKFPECGGNVMFWANRTEPPWKVLVGTILSQRNRDESTAKAAAALFSRYNSLQKLADAPRKDIERLIRSTGTYHQKASYIKKSARIIIDKYEGKVPDTYEGLTTLPGVGHKTADCVLLYGYGVPCIPVDTHVHKISNLLGWVKTKTPEKTRVELQRIVPKAHWASVNCLFVRLGQATLYRKEDFKEYLGTKLFKKYSKRKQFLKGLK